MYKGARDPWLGIIVRQEHCQELIDSHGVTWVEIFFPPRVIKKYDTEDWPSLVVPPEQVFVVDDVYNEIFINAYTKLKLSHKEENSDGVRVIVRTELELSENLIARSLLYEQYQKQKDPAVCMDIISIGKWYEDSGLKMIEAIKRL